VALNKDNSELYYEHVPFDPQTAQADSDKALRVINSANPTELSRVTRDPSDFRCKFCDFASTCWQESEPAKPAKTDGYTPFWIK
jgi:hypothetical protein